MGAEEAETLQESNDAAESAAGGRISTLPDGAGVVAWTEN